MTDDERAAVVDRAVAAWLEMSGAPDDPDALRKALAEEIDDLIFRIQVVHNSLDWDDRSDLNDLFDAPERYGQEPSFWDTLDPQKEETP